MLARVIVYGASTSEPSFVFLEIIRPEGAASLGSLQGGTCPLRSREFRTQANDGFEWDTSAGRANRPLLHEITARLLRGHPLI